MNVAAQIAQRKERHPEKFCPTPRCLWRTDGTHCPRHSARKVLVFGAEEYPLVAISGKVVRK